MTGRLALRRRAFWRVRFLCSSRLPPLQERRQLSVQHRSRTPQIQDIFNKARKTVISFHDNPHFLRFRAFARLLRPRCSGGEASQRLAKGQQEASKKPGKGQEKVSKKLARGQQEASKRPASSKQQEASKMPRGQEASKSRARGQQEASKQPASGQQEASKKPARSQQEASKKPRRSPKWGRPHETPKPCTNKHFHGKIYRFCELFEKPIF